MRSFRARLVTLSPLLALAIAASAGFAREGQKWV
jgi:hypothetical protein